MASACLAEQQDLDLEPDPPSGVTNTEISDVSSPQLPTDCLVPHMLWERATANTTDLFVPMEKFTSGGGMLNLQPSTYLRMWEWREDKINLVGATQAITVRLRYEKVLPALTLGTDPIQIRVGDRSAGVRHRRAGSALSRRTRPRAGFARHRANGHREFDPSATSARNKPKAAAAYPTAIAAASSISELAVLGPLPQAVILSEVRVRFCLSRGLCGRANAVEGPLFDVRTGTASNPREVPRLRVPAPRAKPK